MQDELAPTASPRVSHAPATTLDVGEVKLDLDYCCSVNLAMAHNAVPIVHLLRLTNVTTTPLRDVLVRVEIRPEVTEPWESRITELGPEATFSFDSPGLPLRLERIANAHECEPVQLWIDVVQAERTLLRRCFPLELLSYNEWNGGGALPELLAAFVQPNHPSVAEVLTRAKAALERATGDPSLSGYQSGDPSRVRAVAKAIYTALQELDVSYANPPASFEDTGQKIRTPEQVVTERLGTCVDLSLTVAACLEQVGLHPWIVLLKGHALPGVWLTEETLPSACTDDRLHLWKLMGVGRICFFDASAMVAKPHAPFSHAEDVGRSHLENAEQFCHAIDVRAARRQKILPLPSRVSRDAQIVRDPVTSWRDRAEALVPPAPPVTSDKPRPSAAPLPGRIARWKERLLDLTLRNRLLNLKETARTVPLECPDLARLEDALALNRSLHLLPKAEMLAGSDPRSAKLLDARLGDDSRKAFLLEQLEQHRIHSTLPAADLDRRQLEISRDAKLSLEESGVNTLFLAVGCMLWYENPSAEQPRLAPLVLIPVELSRKSARDPFEMQRIDEETRINVTLLEKLRRDHGIEIPELADEVPQDDAGVDLPRILMLFREAVLNLPRWQVEERAYLGHFSFTKLLMWHDLETGAEALLKNDVVRHLVSGAEASFPGGGDFPAAERLDEERHPADTFCPLDADSTQLAAVFAAEDGKTLVLEGPPGTGKSQTITNLISQCLARGKTVLFVSEKMAALNVVHRRLEAVGLGHSCLELHSNKARKREVLDRLERSWEAYGSQEAPAWSEHANELSVTRRGLNAYVGALHRRHQNGLSVFQGISELIGLQDTPEVSLNVGPAESLTGDRIKTLEEAIARVQAAAEPLGEVSRHPWRAVRQSSWSPARDRAVRVSVGRLADATAELGRVAPACASLVQADTYPMSWAELTEHRRLAELLLRCPGPSSGLLGAEDWGATRAEVAGWIEHGRRRDELQGALAVRYVTKDLVALDLAALHAKLQRWSTAFFLIAFFMLLSVRRALRRVLSSGQRLPSSTQLAQDLAQARELAKETRHIAEAEGRARQVLGGLWPADRNSGGWSYLRSVVGWVDEYRQAVRSFLDRRPAAADAEGQRRRLLALASEESAALVNGGGARQALEALVRAHDAHVAAKDELVASLALDEALAFGDADAPAHLDRVRETLSRWTEAHDQLRDWCHYVATLDVAARAGLQPHLDAHLTGRIPTSALCGSVRRSILELWTRGAIDADPSLAIFHSTEHVRLIRKFVGLDKQVRELSKEIVRARLAARMPNPHTSGLSESELGVLKRELQKKSRHLPIRKLFARIPTLLRRLKPCLLMSPLSVAQYLGANYSPFDVVVFDEASQIPTHDAIGAIGRGRQLIVVGDPKQLPPTSFFSRVGGDDGPVEEDDIEELESILDECLAVGLPRMQLGWHYRSRHESLIAFSNHSYYGNALHTFPAATASREQAGISWRPVPHGHYDKSKSRTNRAEADAVVREVVERLRSPTHQDHSIGVVTFSLAQQRLIEDLLDQERRQHPEIEPYFGSAVEEPLFVKNLENVQGDERDVVLFSICYGPDVDRVVSMNFGPLNRTGGERRLNVAVTRARTQLVVFSTLTPDQIDLNRTRALGVRHLKTFLDYAARGPRAIAEASVPGRMGEFDSPFEAEVARALTERGWTVHSQVGCSSYRIDLAAVHPETPGHYILGIECDGANYHSARSARDRDRLREAVLRELGWRLHRIWSTDWWHNPRRELEKVEEALQRSVAEWQPSVPPGAWRSVRQRSEVATAVEGARAHTTEAAGQDGAAEPVVLESKGPTGPLLSQVGQPEAGVPYPEVSTPARTRDGASFYYPSEDEKIVGVLRSTVALEAPIHLGVLTRRVLAHYELKRATQQAIARVEAILGRADAVLVGDFVWSARQDRARYGTFRRGGAGPDQQRKPNEVAPEEVANAVLAVLQQELGLPRDALVRAASRLLGFNRTGAQVESCVENGIRVLCARGRCHEENGTIKLT